MSQKVYIHETRNPATGWDMRTEIFPASNEKFTNIEYVPLPIGAIEIKKASKKLDKYYFGLVETPTLEFTVNMAVIDDNETYAEFFNSILDPIGEVSVNIPKYYPFPIKVVSGTVVRVSIKYNGNVAVGTDVEYRTFFVGCIRYGDKVEDDMIAETANVTVEALERVILDSFNFYYLRESNISTEDFSGIIEWAFDNKNTGVFTSVNYNNKIRIGSLSEIATYINYMGTQIGRALLRSDAYAMDLAMPCPYFYKQIYDGSGGLGERISPADLRVIVYIGTPEAPSGISGLLLETSDKSLHHRYQNSVWDYLKDFYEYTLRRADIQASGIYETALFVSDASGAEATIYRDGSTKISAENNSNILKTAKVSILEAYTDGSFSDVDNTETTKSGTQNDDEYTISALFNNMPPACAYTKPKGTFYYGTKPHVLNLYYYDTIYNIKRPFRIHEFCEWALGGGKTSRDMEGLGFIPFENSITKTRTATGIAMAMQRATDSHTTLPRLLSRLLMKLFGNNKQHVINVTVPMNQSVEFQDGGSNGFVWWRMETTFKFDKTGYRSYRWKDQYEEWYMIETTLDFESGTADVKLYPRSI